MTKINSKPTIKKSHKKSPKYELIHYVKTGFRKCPKCGLQKFVSLRQQLEDQEKIDNFNALENWDDINYDDIKISVCDDCYKKSSDKG